jgi:hypothetical protein
LSKESLRDILNKWKAKNDKSHRRDAGQYFTAAELCKREIIALITMGNCPNTDILCSNKNGDKFIHIQVKTFVPGNKTCSVGKKAEHNYGGNFFWILAGITKPEQKGDNIFTLFPQKKWRKMYQRHLLTGKKHPVKKGNHMIQRIHFEPSIFLHLKTLIPTGI